MDFDKPKIYGDTSITDGLVLYIELNDLWPKEICKPKMIVWSDATFILRWSCFIWAFHLLQKQGWTKTFVQNCKHGQRQKGMRVGCFAKLQTVTKYLQFQIYVSNINSMLLAVIELPPTLSSVLQTWKSAPSSLHFRLPLHFVPQLASSLSGTALYALISFFYKVH